MQDLTRTPYSRARHWSMWCVLGLLVGCDSKLVLGTWSCPSPALAPIVASAGSSWAGTESSGIIAGSTGTNAEGVASRADIAVPWSTGFEEGFCDYYAAGGTCYAHANDSSATYEIVDEPVHSGRQAAAFRLKSGDDVHTRCYLEGRLPKQAYYGAWYYVPALSKNADLWNLFHFQVHRPSDAPARLSNLLDISLKNDDAGDLRLFVYSPFREAIEGDIPPIPIGKWFQIEMYLKLAADETGEVAVYLDGTRYLQGSGFQTDYSDSEWGQWYIGNLATSLDPAESTLYVDDVTVRASL